MYSSLWEWLSWKIEEQRGDREGVGVVSLDEIVGVQSVWWARDLFIEVVVGCLWRRV